MISNYAAEDIRPGSMGRPLPGIEAAIVKRNDNGTVEVITQPYVEGDLALKPGWPSMFRGYWQDDRRYAKTFVKDWYITGDQRRSTRMATSGSSDGRTTSLRRPTMVGPFGKESALLEHPAVASKPIGVPDPMIGQIVKAFVSLKPGTNPTRRCGWNCSRFWPPEAGVSRGALS